MKNHSGFSLLEALIGTVIFSVILIGSTTILFTLTKTQKKNDAYNAVNSSVQESLSDIVSIIKFSKAIVTSVDTPDDCTQSCLALRQNDESLIIFIFQDNSVFKLQNTLLDQNPLRISSPNIKITNLGFKITRSLNSSIPPAISISISGETFQTEGGKPQLSASIDVQTSVVMRVY